MSTRMEKDNWERLDPAKIAENATDLEQSVWRFLFDFYEDIRTSCQPNDKSSGGMCTGSS